MFWHQKAVSGTKVLLLTLTVYREESILSKMEYYTVSNKKITLYITMVSNVKTYALKAC